MCLRRGLHKLFIQKPLKEAKLLCCQTWVKCPFAFSLSRCAFLTAIPELARRGAALAQPQPHLQCCCWALVVTLHQLLVSWQEPRAARGAATCASGRSIPGQLHRWNLALSGCRSSSLVLLLLPGRAGQVGLPSPLCSAIKCSLQEPPWSCAQLSPPPSAPWERTGTGTDPKSLLSSINN